MSKSTFCICENKGADQLLSNCKADQQLGFCYTDSTIPLISKSKPFSLYPSVLVQPGLCPTCSQTTLLSFSRTGLFLWHMHKLAYFSRIFGVKKICRGHCTV